MDLNKKFSAFLKNINLIRQVKGSQEKYYRDLADKLELDIFSIFGFMKGYMDGAETRRSIDRHEKDN
jgi:hypothetical protein